MYNILDAQQRRSFLSATLLGSSFSWLFPYHRDIDKVRNQFHWK